MIVSLNQLKPLLGIALDDASQDANLTRLIEAKTAWVEGVTRRRFDTPIPHTEIRQCTDDMTIYLHWHVDDEIYDPPLDPSPTSSVRVYRRPIMERFRPWEELVEGDDWERTDQVIYFLRGWLLPIVDEFKIDYLGGYGIAPADIQELVLELAVNQYLMDQVVSETTEGTAGVTSETIGDFSYSADLGSTSTSVSSRTGTGGVSENGNRTIQRYKLRLV